MKKMRPATVLSGYIATRLEMIVATVALKIDIVRGCWRSISLQSASRVQYSTVYNTFYEIFYVIYNIINLQYATQATIIF